MQSELPAIALRDHAGAIGVGELVVTAFTCDDFLIKMFGVKNHLDEITNASAALELNSQLLADGGSAPIGTGEIVTAERFGGAADVARADRYPVRVLREIDEFEAVADSDVRRRLGDFFQQRLKFVLRDELVGFQQPCAIR